MVYETKTFQLCHQLTPIGKIRYRELLEKEGNRLLFRHSHPFKYFIEKLSNIFGVFQ